MALVDNKYTIKVYNLVCFVR